VVRFLFFVVVWCLFGSGQNINFEQVQIQLMTLVSSMLQIGGYGYSKDLNIVIFVGIDALSFYVINMDYVSLFADSSFLF